jgi:hypothetical protein
LPHTVRNSLEAFLDLKFDRTQERASFKGFFDLESSQEASQTCSRLRELEIKVKKSARQCKEKSLTHTFGIQGYLQALICVTLTT